MNKRKNKKRILQYGAIAIICLVAIVVLIVVVRSRPEKKDAKYIEPVTQGTTDNTMQTETQEVWSYEAHETDGTTDFPESVVSSNGLLIDVGSGEVLARRGGIHDRIVPASMTKIMTVLVAAEHIDPAKLDDKVTIDIEATDYSYSNGCSNTGYEVDEQVTVRDLFYGTILPSGADSAYSLAVYVAGSHEAFVAMMNEKLEEMGLAESSHFTNCVGIYEDDHYSTPYDIAMILKAAADNEFCRDVLSAHVYTTTENKHHKEGLTISNWFLRRIEDKDTHGEVLCAKTGYVVQSGSCAASLAQDKDGKEYICVTAGSTSSWRCIYDHVDIYSSFLPSTDVGNEE